MTAANTTQPPSQTARAAAVALTRVDALAVAIPAVLGAGVWLWFGLTTRVALEDAFITFRYARNIALGHGFVYNLGERVLGTTTPLQALLLAALGRVLGPDHIPTIAAWLMPVFGLAAGVLAPLALRRLGLARPPMVVAALVLYLHVTIIRTSLGRMETPLVLFLMALSLYFLAQGRSLAATIAVAFLALCRADGLIWGGLVVGLSLLSRHRRPLAQCIGFCCVIAPWVLFALLYFGSPIPNTILAKGVVRPGEEHQLLQARYVRDLARWFITGTGFALNHPGFRVWVAMLALGAFSLVRQRRRELLLMLAYPPVYAIVLYLGRAPKYPWYLVPALFCSLLVGAAGIGQLLSWAGSRRLDWRWRAVIALCGVAALAPGAWRLARDLPRQVAHTKRFQENEIGLRRGVGLWLRDHTPPDATVAMEAIGYQGYYSQRRVVDLVGLISPKVVQFKASTSSNAEVFKRVTTELQPDYIVLRSYEVDENKHFNGGPLFDTAADERLFQTHYMEMRRFTARHPKLYPLLTHLTLFARRDKLSPVETGGTTTPAAWPDP